MKHVFLTMLVSLDDDEPVGDWFSEIPKGAVYCVDILKELDVVTIFECAKTAGLAHMRRIDERKLA